MRVLSGDVKSLEALILRDSLVKIVRIQETRRFVLGKLELMRASYEFFMEHVFLMDLSKLLRWCAELSI